MIPFAPGVPELYDLFSVSCVKHSVHLRKGYDTGLHVLSMLWIVSCVMVEGVAAELSLPQEQHNLYEFVRVVMQKGTCLDKKNANTENFGSNCESKSFQQLDAKTTGWEVPKDVDVEMGTATGTTMGTVVQDDMKAARENENENRNHLEIDDDISINRASEGQTMKGQPLGRHGDIMMDFTEKVVEVVDMCKEIKSVMRREKKKRAKGIDKMPENKPKSLMKGKCIKKKKGNNVEENNSCHQFKTSNTSNLDSTDSQLSSTPMDDIGPKFESQPK
jgi:hypothetical protein